MRKFLDGIIDFFFKPIYLKYKDVEDTKKLLENYKEQEEKK